MESEVIEASHDVKCEEAPMYKSEMTDDEVIEQKVKFYKERLTKCLEIKRRAELIKIAQQKFIDENKDLIDECDKQGVSLPFDFSFIHPDKEICDEEIVKSTCSSKWADKYIWLSDEEIESMKQQVFKYHEREKEIINEHFRLGSTALILSRSYCNYEQIDNLKEIDKRFSIGVKAIREQEKIASNFTQEDFLKNKEIVCKGVEQTMKQMRI